MEYKLAVELGKTRPSARRCEVKEMWLFRNEVAWGLANVYKMARDGRRVLLFYDKNLGERTIEIEFETEEQAARYWNIILQRLMRNGNAIFVGDGPEND